MLNFNKFQSEKLQTNISCAIMLPDDYNNVNSNYKTCYILSLSNPFEGENRYQELVNTNNICVVAIYPSLNIKKNELLFESFVSKYDFSYLYQDFIINSIMPTLEKLYRLKTDRKEKYIIGLNETSLMSYTMPHDFTSKFGTIMSLGLDVSKFKSQFMAYAKSKFDPEHRIYLNLVNKEDSSYLYDTLKSFGQIYIEETDLDNIFDALIEIE